MFSTFSTGGVESLLLQAQLHSNINAIINASAARLFPIHPPGKGIICNIGEKM